MSQPSYDLNTDGIARVERIKHVLKNADIVVSLKYFDCDQEPCLSVALKTHEGNHESVLLYDLIDVVSSKKFDLDVCDWNNFQSEINRMLTEIKENNEGNKQP